MSGPLPEPDWNVVADLGLKAADDAMDAMSRTVLLAATTSPMDATLISMVAQAILRARHEAVIEAMEDTPIIQAAKAMADDVYETLKGQRAAELKITMPMMRRLLKRAARP